VSSFDHPAVQLQFSNNLVKFLRFFESNLQWIPNALEAFNTYAHSPYKKVRLQSWYQFQRFTKPLRAHLGGVSQTVIQAMADLLTIKAVVQADKSEDDSDDSVSDASSIGDTEFKSQLYLFEAVGCITSSATLPIDTKVLYIQSIVNPIFLDMERNINAAKSGDDQALMQVHHDIMALGDLAHGFTDWMPGQKVGEPAPEPVQEEFVRCGEAILVALESLNTSVHIRQAARYSFSRLLGGMSVRMFPQLPRWIEGLLSRASGKEETGFFMRLLTQVIFAFKQSISSILDAVLTPLFQRVFEKLSDPITGTDDQVHLRELRREFLSFILNCLNHGLDGVFISASKCHLSYPSDSS
jgi:exportin-T